jgi:hypothetical protein
MKDMETIRQEMFRRIDAWRDFGTIGCAVAFGGLLLLPHALGLVLMFVGVAMALYSFHGMNKAKREGFERIRRGW